MSAKLPDTRSPATMVELLIWAYAKQRVRDARRAEAASGPIASSWSTTGIVCRDLNTGAVIRGGGMPYVPLAHPDARAVDDFVLRLPADERALVVRHAEAQAAPDWSPCIPELIVVPVLRGQWTLDTFRDAHGHAKAGAVKTIAGKRDKPIACLIAYEGFPAERAADTVRFVRGRYEAWHCALRILRAAMLMEDTLARWRITGIGAEREPWAPRLSTG